MHWLSLVTLAASLSVAQAAVPSREHSPANPLPARVAMLPQASAPPAHLDAATVQVLADSIFNAALAAKRFKSAALVLVSGDRILLKRGYGWTDARQMHAADPDSTVYSAASVSKVFAAIGLMQLADQGRLDLRAPLRSRLTGIRFLGADAGAVTAEHLLTHTAGLDAKFLGALTPPGPEQPHLRDYFVESPPRVVRRPGSAIAYSNIGAALAGYVVEEVTGQPFYEYAERAICAPFFRPYPAASLVTTPSDMGRFLVALLNGGRIGDGVLLSERALGEMFAPHWRAQPVVPGVTLGFFESFGPAGRALFHTGDGGHHSLLYFVPDRRFGLYAVYDASDVDASRLREELVTVLVARTLGGMANAPMPEPPADFVGRAHEYQGTYRSNSFSHFNMEKLGALPMQLSVSADGSGALLARQFGGGGNARLVEIGRDAFRTSDGGFAAFRRNSSGQVETIVFSGSVWDPSTADRVPWHQRAQVQLLALLLAGLAFAVRLVVGGIRRIRHRGARDAPAPSASWRLSGVQSLIFVAAPVMAPLGLLTSRPPYYSPPWSIYACLMLWLIACGLGVVLVAFAWRERRSGTTARLERGLIWAVAIASVVFTAFLWNWNLLGIHV